MKKKTKKLLTIILSIVLTIGIITAGVFLLKPKDTKRIYHTYLATFTLIWLEYSDFSKIEI